MQGGGSKATSSNGWNIFWAEKQAQRVLLPGETSQECRLRTLDESKNAWQLLSPEVKGEHREMAKACNANKRASQIVSNFECQLACADQEGELALAIENSIVRGGFLLPELLPGNGLGALGCGDWNFGVAEKDVKQADEFFPGFVKHFSSKWRNQCDGISGANSALVNMQDRYKLSCLDQ